MGENALKTGERIKPNTGKLWKVFGILLVLTLVEFGIAFGLDTDVFKFTKISIFVIMTIVKAYYIVGIFMHLGDESKSLKWIVIIPVLFVVWLLVALIVEGGYIGGGRF
jgi:cytochrome c oxidase subunit IV